jgi:hypothetical protein
VSCFKKTSERGVVSKFDFCAKGAKCESQGQARSAAERVAPGKLEEGAPALKGRNNRSQKFRYFGLTGLEK